MVLSNPFRPGAGHKPPYLAGREHETSEFRGLLQQEIVLQNLVLTGLRGVGKTVLLDEFRPLAIASNWLWVGTDLSEAASLTEERLAIRLLADLAAVSSSFVIGEQEFPGFGFKPEADRVQITLSYDRLEAFYKSTPGLVLDKLKATLEMAWQVLRQGGARGMIFAYDEAQNMADHTEDGEYPLSVMLDLFQSLERKNLPFMLVLVGLPTLFPKLVESRTFAERMFHVMMLDKLTAEDTRSAILKPIESADCPFPLAEDLIDKIVKESAGYPYFVQFICREVYDVALQKHQENQPLTVSVPDITRKLDSDFFAGRWSRATDRQRDLLQVIASLETCDDEFTVQDIAEQSRKVGTNPFSPSHVSQILSKLIVSGLVYKNRHGRYSFAVPLLGRFIRRQPAA